MTENMKTVSSSQIQRQFAQLFPLPDEGYKITRDHIVVGYLFPADLAINVSKGIRIDVNTHERARGRCQKCGVQGVLTQMEGDMPKYLCKRCEDEESKS